MMIGRGASARTAEVADYRPRIVRDAVVVAARERLAAVEPGGSPSHPVEVESASQVEVRALSMPCLRCDGPQRLDEHTAERFGERYLRVLRMHCGHCGANRTVYFRVSPWAHAAQ
jgi:hypothetical protein